MRGGVEKPWTMPANTNAFMGLMPKKFMAVATKVMTTIAP